MTPEDKEYLRDSILVILHAAHPLTVPLERVRYGLKRRSFELVDEEVESELSYFMGMGLVEQKKARHSRGAVQYRLTSLDSHATGLT